MTFKLWVNCIMGDFWIMCDFWIMGNFVFVFVFVFVYLYICICDKYYYTGREEAAYDSGGNPSTARRGEGNISYSRGGSRIRERISRHLLLSNGLILVFFCITYLYYKILAYGRHWISRCVRIVLPIPMKTAENRWNWVKTEEN